ncbi:MAG: carbamoyltransferase HypF [Bacteroidales bacterium]|jgi:hydrogenase maturation protein HypF|nr:carbamoyltransferase HypF [Bacteroidales bacterium]
MTMTNGSQGPVKEIIIRGLVQGVGFRPFVFRIAEEMHISGTVSNRNDGVVVHARFSSPEQIRLFRQRLVNEAPPIAYINSMNFNDLSVINMQSGNPPPTLPQTGFVILPSNDHTDEITQIAPDIAVCDKCLNDRHIQPHRLKYPFINCTHCGPRFSIVKALPYDRCNTTMAEFAICDDCRREYDDVGDRRFHAQPVACNCCGPVYYINNEQKCSNLQKGNNYGHIVTRCANLLTAGEVVAVKGIGGYHLLCDATNSAAVERLQAIKRRDAKPFALMFANRYVMNGYVEINDAEAELLQSWRRPIVVLRTKEAVKIPAGNCNESSAPSTFNNGTKPARPVAPNLNPGMNSLGCMLPYMPLHYDLFAELQTPVIVMTSANIADTPIIITPSEAERCLNDRVAMIVHHNREIHNRCDDSVVQCVSGAPAVIRRSRGYTPEPLFIDANVEGIFGFGAEMTATFAMGKGDTIIQSQHIGDLKNAETFDFYCDTMRRFTHLFKFSPKQLVCDLHPDYMTSEYAWQMAEDENIPLLRVQHHHAHAAACMLEHGITEPCIAVILDGAGFGTDDKIWGGEFFLCNRQQFTRMAHFDYVPMPGGDMAVAHPWRMALAYCRKYNLELPASFTDRIAGTIPLQQLCRMLESGINCPETSSAGRLFDAVSALLGLCHTAAFHAEAPMLLEQCTANGINDVYPVDRSGAIISFRPMFAEILDDLKNNVPTGTIAAKFHNSLSMTILEHSINLMNHTSATKVIISGGCFQNKILCEQLQRLFDEADIPLLMPSRIPANDSGISAGQIAVAAANCRG